MGSWRHGSKHGCWTDQPIPAAELATDADLVDEADLPAGSAHDVRHTFATNLLRSGADVVVVAEIMGHRQLDTTRLYTLPSQADIEAAVSRLPTAAG
jgi:site-specific recombinase XerD